MNSTKALNDASFDSAPCPGTPVTQYSVTATPVKTEPAALLDKNATPEVVSEVTETEIAAQDPPASSDLASVLK